MTRQTRILLVAGLLGFIAVAWNATAVDAPAEDVAIIGNAQAHESGPSESPAHKKDALLRIDVEAIETHSPPRSYRFATKVTLCSVSQGSSMLSESSTEIRGRWNLLPRARSDRGDIVQMEFVELDVHADHDSLSSMGGFEREMQSVLSRPFFVAYDSDSSTMRLLHYADGTPHFAKQWIESFIANTTFTRSDAGSLSWEALQEDSTGWVKCSYQRAEDAEGRRHVTRRKERYETLRERTEVPIEISITESRAKAIASVDDDGYWKDLTCDEAIVVRVPDLNMEARVRESLTMTALTVGAGISEVIPIPAKGWCCPFTSRPDEQRARERTADRWRSKLAGKTLQSLLSDLGERTRTEFGSSRFHATFEHLCWLMRVRKGAIFEAHELLLGGAVEPEIRALLLSSMAIAGGSDALKCLSDLFEQPDLDRLHELDLLAALAHVESPEEELFVAAWNLSTRTADVGVRWSSLTALATMMSRPSVAGTPLANQVFDVLVGSRPRIDDIRETSYWLEVLGNCGDPRARPHLMKALEDRSPALRTSAAKALAHDPEPGVAGALVGLCASDPDASVRRTAMEALALRRDGPPLEVWQAWFGSETDAFVRRSILSAISRRFPTSPVARGFLQNASRSDIDSTVRDHANQLLGGSTG